MTTKSDIQPPVEATQILVVGAGPVGLFAALAAARRGLEVTVLEQNFRSQSRGHASLLHPSSLRLLAEFGLSQRLLAEGRLIDRVDLYIDGTCVKTLDLPLPALTVTQSILEELLLKELRREEVEIRSPCEATALTIGPERVQARIVRRELAAPGPPSHGDEWQPVESSLLDAQFVIGADGYDSHVRAALGLSSLDVGATETFAMFEGPNPGPGSTLELAFLSGLGSIAFPLPRERARWGFQIESHFDAPADLERLRALHSEHAPWRDRMPDQVEWGTVTHFERRVARRFGAGRVWLAGDSAHVTSPFGAQSMNGGFTEAHDLVEHMANCLLEGRSLATLEQLAAAREREWQKLLGFDVQFDVSAGAPEWLRAHARKLVPALPASGLDLQHLLRTMGITIR